MRIFALIGVLLLGLPQAIAETKFSDIVAEARFGVLAFNPDIGINPSNEGQEGGVSLQGELVFHTPKRLRWKYFFSPEPFIVGSINTGGDTSYGGFGLSWDWQLGKKGRWEFESALAYIVHDGTIDVPFPGVGGNLENLEVSENNILFGSRDLFRTTFGLNRHLDEHWGVSFYYEHLSHGQILGNGRNQGSDSLGGRIYYRFGKTD
jgi:lipid A 3-O-deacylase